MKRMRWFSAILLAVGTAAGCAPKGPTTQPGPVEPVVVSTRSELEQKIQQITQMAAAFSDTAEQLANRGDQDHRMLVEQALTQLLEVMPMLADSQLDGGLHQRIRIIAASRDQLRNIVDNQSAAPAVNTALRSAAGALQSIADYGFADQVQVSDSLRLLSGKIAELDAVTGAIHRLVTTQCLGLMAQAVQGMSQTAIGRLQEQIQHIQPAGE